MNDIIDIKFARLTEDAKIPFKRDEDAGYDIYPSFEEKSIIIKKGETAKIGTGICSAIPKEFCFVLKERSSTSLKGLKISGGVIDSGYRGEWNIAIYNGTNKKIIITKEPKKYTSYKNDYIIYPYNKAIAQALLLLVPNTKTTEVSYDELLKENSERGSGGFGSTGK